MKKKLILIILCLVLLISSAYGKMIIQKFSSGGAANTITYGNDESASAYATGTTIALSTGVNVSSGDLIVVAIHWPTDGTAISSVADQVSTSFTIRPQISSTGNFATVFAYGVAGGVDTTNIVTVTWCASQQERKTIIVSTYTKNTGTWAFDVTNSQASAWGSAFTTTPNVTTTASAGDSELCIALMGLSATRTMSAQTIIDVSATVITTASDFMHNFYLIRTGGESGVHADATASSAVTLLGEMISFKLT